MINIFEKRDKMLCRKCNTELPEGSLFCNKCGTKTKTMSDEKLKNKKKWIILSSVSGVIIVAGIIALLLYSNPVQAFKKAIENNRYSNANQIFENEIKGDLNKEATVEEFLQLEISTTVQKFIEKKIDLNAAVLKLEAIEKTQLLDSAVSESLSTVTEINDSRTAYKTGEELLKNNHIKEAILELKKVSEADSENFESAQELIASTTSDYKDIVLKEGELLVSENKFKEAIDNLNSALTILKNDSDLLAKQTSYQKQQEDHLAAERKKKVEELEKKQEMTVVSLKTFKDRIDSVHLSIVVKNNSDKVVKKFSIGWMGYDENGYPVKTGWLSPDFLKLAEAEANIQPNKTFGSGYGWRLTGGYSNTIDATTFIACVKEVEYYDGTKWENEYFTYWVEDHKEKELK